MEKNIGSKHQSFKDIVVVRNSEILPSDGEGARLWRSGIMAQYFVDKGYPVRWIIASFDHYHKTQRNIESVEASPDVKGLIVLKTPSYQHNISLARFVEHLVFGWKLFLQLRKKPTPKIIICSWPTPESSFFSVLYGLMNKVPVVLDIRDKWPDLLLEGRSPLKKLLFRVATLPYHLMLKFSMKNATALVGVNQDFLDWGRKHGHRNSHPFDFVSHIPFKIPHITSSQEQRSIEIYQQAEAEGSDLVVGFAGTLGNMFNFDPLIDCIDRARKGGIKLKFLICGDGGSYEQLKRQFVAYPEVFFSGRIDAGVVFELLKKSDVLLACYKDFDNFRDHLPNKFMEYLAAGRPIITSTQGLAWQILKKADAGATYSNSLELLKALETYVKSPSCLQAQAKNSGNLYRYFFDPNAIMQAFEKGIDLVIQNYKP